jgi:phosphoribosyl 1,2-cyclic phosphate phosphodiesterase
MDGLELLFLGSGTSAGIPMIGCHCEVCTSNDPHDKRTRTSVVISYHGKHVLIDTTPELRLQCVANKVDWIDAVVMTHGHADHIMGLDDVRRFNAIRCGPLDVWASPVTHKKLTECFGYAFCEPDPAIKVFRPNLVRRVIDADKFQVEGVTWTLVPLLHGDMPVLGFRVGKLAYCTDVSTMPESSFALLEGLDVLVLDALAWHKHPTHFSIEEALAVVDRVKPRRTFFTHIAHNCGHVETNARLPAGVELAYDGLRVRSEF